MIGWTCDKCDKPILDGDMRYTGADDPEAGKSRHAKCQPTHKDLRRETDDAMARAKDALMLLKRELGTRRRR